MRTNYAHVIADTGIAGAPVGGLIEITSYQHMGDLRGAPLLSVTVEINGRPVQLPTSKIEMLDAAQAKQLRLARKRASDRAKPSWRGGRTLRVTLIDENGPLENQNGPTPSRSVTFHAAGDMSYSDAIVAVRYHPAGKVYARSLVLPADPRAAINVQLSAASLYGGGAFRGLEPKILGWAVRRDLGHIPDKGAVIADSDPANWDPDFATIGRMRLRAGYDDRSLSAHPMLDVGRAAHLKSDLVRHTRQARPEDRQTRVRRGVITVMGRFRSGSAAVQLEADEIMKAIAPELNRLDELEREAMADRE